MEQRERSVEYERIARELIENDSSLAHVKGSAAKIAYLVSDKEKTSRRKPVLAECEKVPDKYRWSVPYDFTITVFEPNVERFDDEKRRILMLHELMHVGVERDGNEEAYYVVPHDIEDFEEVIERYGARWSR